MNEIQQLTDLVRNLTLEQSQSEAGKALTRRLVRQSYEAWCRYTMAKVDKQPAAHHLVVIRAIQDLLDNNLDHKKVMLLMPPGSAKSTYTSARLGPWFLNPLRCPRDRILACSYAYTLAEDFGEDCRDLVAQESDVLGISLSNTSAAAGAWKTSLGGEYYAAGVGAGIAGRRAALGLIDDYLGSEQDADSETVREKIWKWYHNDFWPRLLPSAWVILIANRRHEDDLVGRLLNSEGNEWKVIKLPYFARENDPIGRQPAPLSILSSDDETVTPEQLEQAKAATVATRLWPEWFDEAHAQKVLTLPARTRAGLFQQEPAPEEGDYFKKNSIVEYNSPSLIPSNLRIYVGADYAVRKESRNDKFCFIPAGLDTNGVLWVLPDWFWEQSDTLTAVDRMLEMARRRRPIVWWAGRENITGSIAPFLNERMRAQHTYLAVEELSESKNKEAKAQSIKARMSCKTVMFPSFAPGWDEAKNELLTFPGGTNDDFVDALSKLGQGLDKMVPASRPQPQWDGKVPQQRLTCSWVERSHKRRMRERDLAMSDQ